MLTSRHITILLLLVMLSCAPVLIHGTHDDGVGVAYAQQKSANPIDDTARGIELYRRGDTLGAMEALRTATKYHKDDADAWLYLGLALIRIDRTKEARKAFETAVNLNPNSAQAHTGLAYTLLLTNKVREGTREAERALALDAQNAEAHYLLGVARMKENEPSNALKHLEAALSLKPEFSPALLLKSQAILRAYAEKIFFSVPSTTAPTKTEPQPLRHQSLKEAAQSLDKYLQLNPAARDAALWRAQLEALRPYAEDADKPAGERTFFSVREVTTRARIINKPEPAYTSAARSNQVSGTVMLSVVLADDGTIKHILVLNELPYGLTEKAVEAAKKIKFVPATKDGRPVSMVVIVEYNFNIY
jgi:TonB family protein